MAYNSMDYSAKDTVLDVVRTERANFFDIIDDPNNWNVQTRCTEWEVRDIAGHMIDVTEGYLSRWDMARKGEPADALGLLVMGERLNENAQAFRSLPREEAIARLKADSDRMLATFDALTPEEWGSFNVTHPYMGPLPTLFYPAFHVMDYGVHTWDMRWGLGAPPASSSPTCSSSCRSPSTRNPSRGWTSPSASRSTANGAGNGSCMSKTVSTPTRQPTTWKERRPSSISKMPRISC
jgi:uncharacterized protein (TIGR03083 family)